EQEACDAGFVRARQLVRSLVSAVTKISHKESEHILERLASVGSFQMVFGNDLFQRRNFVGRHQKVQVGSAGGGVGWSVNGGTGAIQCVEDEKMRPLGQDGAFEVFLENIRVEIFQAVAVDGQRQKPLGAAGLARAA